MILRMTTGGDGIPEQQRRRSRLADLDLPGPPPQQALAATSVDIQQEQLRAARREFAVLLGEFRRTAVLVPLDAGSTDGMLFPPVAGIVPDAVAVDLGGTR